MTINENQEKIEMYCMGNMPAQEKIMFEMAMQQDATLAKAVKEHRRFLALLNHKTSKDFISNQLTLIRKENTHTSQRIVQQMQLHIQKYWRTATVAASVALVASTLSFITAKNFYKKDSTAHYVTLSNKLNKIERKQNDLQKDLSKVKSASLPEKASTNAGTSFALNNNGLLLTNAHVVEGGNSFYVITKDGLSHKASLVQTDAELDLAILKIDEEKFKFSKEELPYSLNLGSSSISQRVYTMGFPKDEIVYNEGYISSINGRDGDSTKYQMELPSSFGASGAPVFDEQGNVLAIITGKESTSEGITYAVKSKKINKFLSTLDKENKLAFGKNLKGLPRNQQIKTLASFVCEVKVY